MTVRISRFVLFACALATTNVVRADEGRHYVIDGKIVAVSDGDTITLLDHTQKSHKIRLKGIDAPEKRQSFGTRSAQHLSRLVFGKIAIAECGKRDRYGREVCRIIVGEEDINHAQVAAGMAWWYRDYAREQSKAERHAYEQAEVEARHRRLGLWADDAPVPPWEWRRMRRAANS